MPVSAAESTGQLASPLLSILSSICPVGVVSLHRRDLLIHAPGFEDRTVAFPGTLKAVAGASALLLNYRPYNSLNRNEEVRRLLMMAGVCEIIECIYDRFDPTEFDVFLRELLSKHNYERVVVDISSMSKLAVVLVLDACRSVEVEMDVLYAEAARYGPTESEFEDARVATEGHRPSLQIYSGVQGVVRTRPLASVSMQGQPTAAVAFMSFNDALTQTLLNTVYPARLFLINGRPPEMSWREEATAWIHERLRLEWSADNPVSRGRAGSSALPERVASTLDYRETVALLLELYWELSAAHRILLAPTGSKMQTVGCALVKGLHPDIHIEYPSAEGFREEYSDGIGRKWRVSLGLLSGLMRKLHGFERRDRLEVSWSNTASVRWES